MPQHCVDLRVHQVGELLALSGKDAAAAAAAGADGGPAAAQAAQAQSTSYALVIRLEALTEEGRQSGRQLESLEPGCELPEWVQAQSTYVRLVRDDDGHLGARVLKQTIWVKGESYELQEIYGMERSTAKPAVGTVAMCMPTTADGLEDVDGNECVICMSAPRDTAALPCRHMCMCHTCAGELKSQVRFGSVRRAPHGRESARRRARASHPRPLMPPPPLSLCITAQTNKCPICRNEIEKLLHIKIVHKGANANGSSAAAAGQRAAGPSGSGAAPGPSSASALSAKA